MGGVLAGQRGAAEMKAGHVIARRAPMPMLPRMLAMAKATVGMAEAAPMVDQPEDQSLVVEEVKPVRVGARGEATEARRHANEELGVAEGRRTGSFSPTSPSERTRRGARELAALRQRLKARMAAREEAGGTRPERTAEALAEATRATREGQAIGTPGRLAAGPSNGGLPPPCFAGHPLPEQGGGTADGAAVEGSSEMEAWARDGVVGKAWAGGGGRDEEGRRGGRRALFDEEGDLRLELSR